MKRLLLPLVALAALAWAETLALDSPAGLKPNQVKAEAATFKGRKAVRVTDASSNDGGDTRFAIIPNTSLQDGVIEVDLAGDVMPNVGPGARGFVGVVFRAAADGSK